MKVKQKDLLWSSLPSAKDKKKIMANTGMTMEPGPRNAGFKNLIKTLPPDYFDTILPSKVQGPVDMTPTPNTSKALPQQPSTANTPKPNIPKDPSGRFNPGNMMLLGLSAFDAILPNRVQRQQVVEPQLAYNPHPYGTGSQALMDSGGYIMGEDENNVPGAKSGIYIKPSKRGTLRKALGVKEGQKIPASKLQDKPGDSPAMKKKKNFARNARKWKHDEGGIVPFLFEGIDQTFGAFGAAANALVNPTSMLPIPMKQGGIIPDPMSNFNPKRYDHGGEVKMVGPKYPNTDLLEQFIQYCENGGVMGPPLLEKFIKYENGGYHEVGPKYPNTDLLEQYIQYNNGGIMSANVGMSVGDPTDPKPIIRTKTDEEADFADQINNLIAKGIDPYSSKEGKATLSALRAGFTPQFASDLGVRARAFQTSEGYGQMTPEQRLEKFYGSSASDSDLDKFLRRAKVFGGSPSAYYQNSPLNRSNTLSSLIGNSTTKMKSGGIMYDDGGQLNTMWGGNAEMASYNPYDGGMVEFKGASHENGGIGMAYNNNPVEVEGGEFAAKDKKGNLNIFGNMYLPGTKTKFKTVAKEIAQKEKRYDGLKSRGAELVNNSNPHSRFDQLSFNSGKIMMEGGEMGQIDIVEKKNKLSSLQRAMLDTADQFGLDPQEMSKGKVKKAKRGASIPFFKNGGDPNDPTRSDRNKNPGNIKYGKFAKKYGATKDKDGFAIFPTREKGMEAMQALLKSPTYNKLSVRDAIKKWTGGEPYRYNLGQVEGKKVSDLRADEFGTLIDTMVRGEGTRYGNIPRTVPNTPTPQVVAPPTITPYGLPPVSLTPNRTPEIPETVIPPYDELNPPPDRQPLPSNVEPLHLNQVLGEIYAAATNKVEPVPAQRYEPQLFTPYQVSFQDRINRNQNAFSAAQRSIGATNPSALGAIAAQLYEANNSVAGDEFRTNQAISNDITNKNIALLNDAQLKNLGIADTQMVRQSTARSKTRQVNQMIVNSLADKYAQNEYENKRLAAYENLYDYRYVPTEDGGLYTQYYGPDAVFNYNTAPDGTEDKDVRTTSRYDAEGNLRGYSEQEDSELKKAERRINIESKRRRLPLLQVPRLQ